MLNLTIAGNLGRDAEHKTTQAGKEFCSFAVAVSVGYGENKSTVWIDVTRWGNGAAGLANILRKGSKVAATGEMGLREHNGKTYVQLRADNVTVMGTPGGGEQRRDPPAQQSQNTRESLDDDIPF